MLTTSVADFEGSALQCATMLTGLAGGAADGAAYAAVEAPVVVIVPTVELPLATPLTVQLTVGSGCPALATVAFNGIASSVTMDVKPDGMAAMVTVISLIIARAALPVAEVSDWFVAVMVTVAGLGN